MIDPTTLLITALLLPLICALLVGVLPQCTRFARCGHFGDQCAFGCDRLVAIAPYSSGRAPKPAARLYHPKIVCGLHARAVGHGIRSCSRHALEHQLTFTP